MAWNQLSDIVAALTTVWLLPYPQLPAPLCGPHTSPSSLLSLHVLLYIAVSISALPGGWSCRSRLWEICVGNPIWSPQDLSEWAASVCGHKLDTGLIRMRGLTVPGWMERSEATGLAVKLMRHYCVPQLNQVARLSQAKWGWVLATPQVQSQSAISKTLKVFYLLFIIDGFDT